MAADLVSRSHNLLDRVEGTLRHQSQHNKALSMELQPYALRCLRKKTAMEYYYCPRQGRIRCFGQGKPFVLNADASRSQSRSPWASRSCPKRTASLFLGKNASNHRQTGCLAASRELSQTGAIPAAGDFPVQNSDRQNVSWTRVMEYRIETSPRTAVSARRSSIIRSQEFS